MTTTKKPHEKPHEPPRREDRPGHLDPAYAESLRELGGHSTDKDDNRAFIGRKKSRDALAEELGEEAVVAMTTGEDGLAEDLQADVDEESGGPFVETNGRKEFASGTDASNPVDAEREPFPKT